MTRIATATPSYEIGSELIKAVPPDIDDVNMPRRRERAIPPLTCTALS